MAKQTMTPANAAAAAATLQAAPATSAPAQATRQRYDVFLEGWPMVRIPADDPDDARAEYKRLYGIDSSHNPVVVMPAGEGPGPAEPAAWAKIRKQIKTLGTERLS